MSPQRQGKLVKEEGSGRAGEEGTGKGSQGRRRLGRGALGESGRGGARRPLFRSLRLLLGRLSLDPALARPSFPVFNARRPPFFKKTTASQNTAGSAAERRSRRKGKGTRPGARSPTSPSSDSAGAPFLVSVDTHCESAGFSGTGPLSLCG